jgi:xylose isomerase
MAKVTAFQNSKNKPTFDPQASYKWEPDDVFEITGLQLAALYHCLITEVNEPQGASIAQKYEAYASIMDVFKRGVEQSVILKTSNIEAPEVIAEELDKKVGKLFGERRNPDDLPHWHPNS